MGTFIISLFYVAFLPFLISGNRNLSDVLNKINEISKNGKYINDIFKPANKGLIKKGTARLFYKGEKWLNKKNCSNGINLAHPQEH